MLHLGLEFFMHPVIMQRLLVDPELLCDAHCFVELQLVPTTGFPQKEFNQHQRNAPSDGNEWATYHANPNDHQHITRLYYTRIVG